MVALSLFFWVYLAITLSFVNSFRGSFGFHRLSSSKRGFSTQPTTSSQQHEKTVIGGSFSPQQSDHRNNLILSAHEQRVISRELTIKNIDNEANKAHLLVTVNSTLTDKAHRQGCEELVKVNNY